MLSVDEAFQCIVDSLPNAPVHRVPLQHASGEILAEAVLAERDQPPFDRVTMDGVALRHAAWAAGRRTFRSIGTQAAGAPAMVMADEAGCVEVMTGTPLPSGTDCVVPVERLRREEGEGQVMITLADDLRPGAGEFIHLQGSDYMRAATLLTPGTPLGPPEMAVLASSGMATIAIARRPRIAVLPTGDELIAPGRPVADYQIRRSNDFALAAALMSRGFRTIEVEALRDDPRQLEAAIDRHLHARDVLILSGGVSMGRSDHVPRVLESLGVETVFNRVQQKPGNPMWFGIHRRLRSAVFALPGNPVGSLICLTRFVLPALRHALGGGLPPAERVVLGETASFKPALTWHLPVHLDYRPGGSRAALPHRTSSSGGFAALAGTAGFVELPPATEVFPAGFEAAFWRW